MNQSAGLPEFVKAARVVGRLAKEVEVGERSSAVLEPAVDRLIRSSSSVDASDEVRLAGQSMTARELLDIVADDLALRTYYSHPPTGRAAPGVAPRLAKRVRAIFSTTSQ